MMIKRKKEPDFAVVFYERYRGLMLRMALYLTKDQTEAEDLMQESLCHLVEKMDILETLETCQVEAYIARTMRNCRNKGLQKERPILFADMDESVLEQQMTDRAVACGKTPDILTHTEVTLLMQAVSEEDRILLEGKYLRGSSDAELAKKLRCKPDSIRMKLHRARKRAYKILNTQKEV